MQPTPIRVSGAHGLSLQLLEWSQEGPALLFLHGFDNDAHVWDEFAPTFVPYYRTLALDQRGHGESDWDAEIREFFEEPFEIEQDNCYGVHSVAGHRGWLLYGWTQSPLRLARRARN